MARRRRTGTVEAVITSADREEGVTAAFVGLADVLVDDYDVVGLLDRLATHCVDLLAVDSAGIMLADAQHRLRVVASTDERSDWMELLQLEADEGPCVDCYRDVSAVSVTDLALASSRWPRFVADLAVNGIFGSVHALPLRLRDEAVGALNLFCRLPGPLSAADLVLGQALADVATIGLLAERAINRGEVLNEQLQGALASRVIIEQAKGVLAERGGLGMGEAFDRLRRYARRNNLPLAKVARAVVETPAFVASVLAVPENKPRPS